MSGARWFVGLALSVLTLPTGVQAQVAERVREVEDGTVRFGFAIRPEVEICDRTIRVGERQMWWRSTQDDYRPRNCRTGFAEVELEIRRGRVTDVEIVRQMDGRVAGAVDLGEVAADEAARYLLSLAYDGASPDGAEEAIFPAMIAETREETWPALLEIARDRSVDRGVRKSTLFWLGQAAAEAATEGLTDVAFDEEEDQEVREAAVFAISQRPDDEAIPILIDIARTAEEAETRRKAMFWLAQSEDDRVVDFFAKILLGRDYQEARRQH